MDEELLLRSGPKVTYAEHRDFVVGGLTLDTLPMDYEASATFLSGAGGFIPPEIAGMHVLSNPPHYGAGGFEGVRGYYSLSGTVFPNLPWNIGRLLFSETGIDGTVAMRLIESAVSGTVIVPWRSNSEIFSQFARKMHEGREPELHFRILRQGRAPEEVTVPWRLPAVTCNILI
ncbi:MAG: hypothetical protein ABII22_00890 [Candidatus Micrarchaeota archaeon]